jgi:hypothetical protein
MTQRANAVINLSLLTQAQGHGWLARWKDGWMDGWMDGWSIPTRLLDFLSYLSSKLASSSS